MECIFTPAQVFRHRAATPPLLFRGRQFTSRREATDRQSLFRRNFVFFRAVAIVTLLAGKRLRCRRHAFSRSPTGTRMR